MNTKQQSHSTIICKCIASIILLLIFSGNIYATGPTITFKVGNKTGNQFSVGEDTASRQIELIAVLSQAMSQEVSFTYELLEQGTTATRNADFQFNTAEDPTQRSKSVLVTFNSGQTELIIPITIMDDAMKEDNEILRFFMKNATLPVTIPDIEVYITITDNEEIPKVILSSDQFNRDNDNVIVAAIDEGSGITLKLDIINNISSFDIETQYRITYDPPEEEITDYEIQSDGIIDQSTGILIIPAQQEELDFDIFFHDDSIPEETEVLTLEILSDPEKTKHAEIQDNLNKVKITINDINSNAGAINDTGVTQCYNENKEIISDCNNADFPEQDGISTDLNRLNRFVKLNSNGTPEPSPGFYTQWDCVLDENTNLVWQVKDADFDFDTRDESTYTWFNPIDFVNGGNEGFTGSGSGDATDEGGPSCTTGLCNTSDYASTITKQTLCGLGNWRVPSLNELLSIIDFEADNDNKTIINTSYFLHTIPSFYWTSTPGSVLSDDAWCIYFGKVLKNHAQLCKKEQKLFLRLVKTYNPS